MLLPSVRERERVSLFGSLRSLTDGGQSEAQKRQSSLVQDGEPSQKKTEPEAREGQCRRSVLLHQGRKHTYSSGVRG